MGISQAILVVDDDALRGLVDDPSDLVFWAKNRGLPGVHVLDYWRGLADMLTYAQRADRLPYASLTTGELRYSNDHDGAHALLAEAAAEFAALVDPLTEADVRAYVERRRDQTAAKFAGRSEFARLIPNEATMRQETAEFWLYLRMVKEIAAKASAAKAGLLFCFYEDW